MFHKEPGLFYDGSWGENEFPDASSRCGNAQRVMLDTLFSTHCRMEANVHFINDSNVTRHVDSLCENKTKNLTTCSFNKFIFKRHQIGYDAYYTKDINWIRKKIACRSKEFKALTLSLLGFTWHEWAFTSPRMWNQKARSCGLLQTLSHFRYEAKI